MEVNTNCLLDELDEKRKQYKQMADAGVPVDKVLQTAMYEACSMGIRWTKDMSREIRDAEEYTQ